MTVVATGGIAALFHDATDAIDHFDPDVTLRGLLEIYRRNAGVLCGHDRSSYEASANAGSEINRSDTVPEEAAISLRAGRE